MGMVCILFFVNLGFIFKDFLYGELVEGLRLIGRLCLYYKDVCKRDFKVCNINIYMWEISVEDFFIWCIIVVGVYMKLRR